MLTGTRVELRLLAAGDRDLYRALWTSPEVMEAIGAPLTLPTADAQFERVVRHNMLQAPGHRTWCIRATPDAVSLGVIALLRNRYRAEMGIMLLPTAQRRRIGSGALEVLLPYAFETLQLECIEAGSRLPMAALLAPFGFASRDQLRGLQAWELRHEAWRCRPRTLRSNVSEEPPALVGC